MVEEAKVMLLGEMLAKAFFRRIHNTASGQLKPEFRIIRKSVLLIQSPPLIICAAFRYNVKDMFVGTILGGEPAPMSLGGRRILQNPSFLATSLLHHNPARGDAAFIRVTGNDPSVPQLNSTPLAQTLNAFAHFAYAHTGGTHLLVDFQGAKLLNK